MNLHVGPFALQWAHVLALACALLASGVGWLVGRTRRVSIVDVLFDMALVAVPAGRAVFVALWLPAFQDAPWSIFDIRDGGIEPWSATAAALMMAVWRVHQHPALGRPLSAGLLAGVVAWSMVLLSGIGQAPAGQKIPELTFKNMDGLHVPLTTLARGQPMVVNLWATWCPPCQREMPALAHAQHLHPQVQFVFVNEGESLAVVRRYLQMVPFQLQHVLADEGNALGRAMDSTALPMTLIYGADGRLAFSHQGLISEAVLAMQLERCCRSGQ